jgi:RNase H-fold protein (predicted Holliday junction resolvase)
MIFINLCILYLVKTASFEINRARIGVDYGPRVIGIAASIGSDTRPLRDIKNCGNLTAIATKTLDIARHQSATEILVGVPLDKDGVMSLHVRNFNGRLCLMFATVLRTVCTQFAPDMSIRLVDERFSTREAKIRLRLDDYFCSLDAMSAACILERYIEDTGEGSIEPELCEFPIPLSIEEFDYNNVREHVARKFQKHSEAEHNALQMQRLKEGKKIKRWKN